MWRKRHSNLEGRTEQKKFSIHLVGQEIKYCGGIGMKDWNGQCLGPRRGGLELVVHNPEINWEKREVRMTKYPPLCRKMVKIKGNKKTREDEKNIVRWAVDEKNIVRWTVDEKKD